MGVEELAPLAEEGGGVVPPLFPPLGALGEQAVRLSAIAKAAAKEIIFFIVFFLPY